MQVPDWIDTPDGPVFGTMANMRGMTEWKATVTQVRDAILAFMVTGTSWDFLPLLPEAKDFGVKAAEVEMVSELCREAVAAGRMIDFGYLPNEVMKECADRGGPMWNAGAFGMPFSEPWVLYHTWEQGTCVYLINPLDSDRFECCELQPILVDNARLLTIADRGMFDRVEGMLPEKRYHCSIAPSAIRFLEDDEQRLAANNGGTPQTAAAGNIGDPVMTALLILNTRNVDRETIEASPKLQRARAKNHKPPIPPYDVVHSAPYVTAIQSRGVRRKGESLGGTHASPQFHIRMGHPRRYTSERWKGAAGKSIFIPDTLVNATDEQRAAFKSQRSHYRVR